jgi:uncharacterized protein YcbK (DUF882 family)
MSHVSRLMRLRGKALGTAFVLLLGATPGVALGEGDEGAEDSAASTSAPAAASAASEGEDGAAPRKSAKRRGKSRSRKPKFSGRVVPEEQLRKEPLPRPSGKLHLVSVANSHEQAKVNIYNSDGSYNLEALNELNFVLRCRRTDVEKQMDPQLLTYLSHVYDHFGQKPLEVVSGYRNQRKLSSNHAKAIATDIRIKGVSPKEIRAFAETMDRGGMGIGFYPRSQFVHIDVRSPPSYRWVDYSPPNPDAPEKRPPRGWKRKKLQS